MNGYTIRIQMAEKNIKVNDIARKLGVTHVAVSKVIHGRAKSARVMSAIADAVGKPISELWPDLEPGA